MNTPQSSGVPAAAALYLGVIQFVFACCWTIYVIFLPGLLETAGIPRRYMIYVLMLDQLIFLVADVTMGIAADRVRSILGRLGPAILAVTTISCAAFLLIPYAAGAGAYAPVASLIVLLAWTMTSSALRAPPWVLIGRYVPTPSLPWMNALLLTGMAVAGALAPYFGIALKNIDPRLPFAVSSIALFATAAGLIRIERGLARLPAVPAPPAPPVLTRVAGSRLFLGGIVVLALGFQIHFTLNSGGQYLRYAPPGQLQYLMPVFWIGFNVAMFPGAALARRFGAIPVMAGAAMAGAGATLACPLAGSLDVLLAAQLLAGGAWGCVLMAGFSAALELGRTGREGCALGLLFAALAFATLARMSAVALEIVRIPAVAPALGDAVTVLWCAGAIAFLALARRRPPGNVREPAA